MYVVNAVQAKERQDPGYVPKRLAIPGEKQQEPAAAKTGEAAGAAGKNGVSLTISEEAYLQQMYQEQLEAGKQEAEAFKDMAKIMEVARRIANGDKVPPEDEKKLMEFNPDLYQAAKAAAIVNAHKKHKEYDSLFEEDEDGCTKEKLRALEQESSESAEGTQDAEAAEPASPSV